MSYDPEFKRGFGKDRFRTASPHGFRERLVIACMDMKAAEASEILTDWLSVSSPSESVAREAISSVIHEFDGSDASVETMDFVSKKLMTTEHLLGYSLKCAAKVKEDNGSLDWLLKNCSFSDAQLGSALMVSIDQEREWSFAKLISSGVDVSSVRGDGDVSPLSIAVMKWNDGMTDALLSAGAKVQEGDWMVLFRMLEREREKRTDEEKSSRMASLISQPGEAVPQHVVSSLVAEAVERKRVWALRTFRDMGWSWSGSSASEEAWKKMSAGVRKSCFDGEKDVLSLAYELDVPLLSPPFRTVRWLISGKRGVFAFMMDLLSPPRESVSAEMMALKKSGGWKGLEAETKSFCEEWLLRMKHGEEVKETRQIPSI